MKRQFRVIRENGNNSGWLDMDDMWTIDTITTFANIMNNNANDWQIEYRDVEE